MKKLLPFSLSVSLVMSLCLSSKAQMNTLYEELVSVNPEWKHQEDMSNVLKTEPAKSLSEQQLVQLHLSETEKLLRSRNINNLSLQQKENRLRNLDVLHRYMLAGRYPVNSMHMNRQPYFIDDNNTYCAVGYLMKESGADSIARYIHQTQNFNYLKDIVHNDLMKWAEQSGLTIDELALIQPGYGGEIPSTPLELHYNNAGDDVNEYIEIQQSTGELVGWNRFNRVFFYNNNGMVYKSLAITDMTSIPDNYAYYYYLFPVSDSFANAGQIEIRYQDDQTNQLLTLVSYNSDSVSVTNFQGYSNQSYVFRHNVYPVAENETTPINTSLTFCGHYLSNWNLSTQAATPGTISSCVIYPITLGKFSYSVSQNKVTLNWETLSEINSKFFSVERSIDGANFKEIGSVPAAGNGRSGSQYHFIDNNPQYINYYRLKQVDISGATTYSKVLYVKVETVSKLILKQTVVNADLVYQNTSSSGDSKIEVYDVTGKKIFGGIAGSGVAHINVSSYASGKYFIRLVTATGEVYTRQFMKP